MSLPPRLDDDEIEYLNQFLALKDDHTTMVEWGSGGSTAMFVPYFRTGRLISIEHNHEWFDKVKEELQTGDYDPECLKNFIYAFVPPIVDARFYGYGVPYEENPCFAKDYINPPIVDNGERVNIWNSDIFFVDGICRGPILATLRVKATKLLKNYDDTAGEWKPPCTIFIHDYYGMEMREPWYNWASSLFGKVERVGNSLAKISL